MSFSRASRLLVGQLRRGGVARIRDGTSFMQITLRFDN
jgi:hypothetical protein